jgi:hypothetical protein
MKATMIAVIALAMITASVKAELGETPKQFEPGRADETKAVSFVVGGRKAKGYYSIWKGRNLTHYGFFYEGRAVVESFWFNDRHQMTDAEWARFFKPYSKRFTLGKVIQGQDRNGRPISWAPILHHNGTRYGVVEYDHIKNTFGIYRADAWDYYSRMQGYIAVRQKSRTQLVYATAKQPDHNDVEREPGVEEHGDESYPDPTPTSNLPADLAKIKDAAKFERFLDVIATPGSQDTGARTTKAVRAVNMNPIVVPLYGADIRERLIVNMTQGDQWGHWRLIDQSEWLQTYEEDGAFRSIITFSFDNSLVRIDAMVFESDGSSCNCGGYETLEQQDFAKLARLLIATDAKQQPQQQPLPQQEDENDCVIVATKHLNELGNSVPWKQMLMFVYIVDGKREAIGHAVAVFKRSNDGNVWVNDKSGSDQIATTSTDANEILRVLGEKYSSRFHKQITLIGQFDKGS